jgi:hypothetical protein
LFEATNRFLEANMFKRIILAVTFAATVGGASLFMADQAEARRWVYYSRPYSSYYYGPRVYGFGNYVAPYRAYYGGYYGPRRYYYGSPGYYYNGPRVGVFVRPGLWR